MTVDEQCDESQVARQLGAITQFVRQAQRASQPPPACATTAEEEAIKRWLEHTFERTSGRFDPKDLDVVELRNRVALNFETVYELYHRARITQEPLSKRDFEKLLVRLQYPVKAVSNKYFCAKRAVFIRDRMPTT